MFKKFVCLLMLAGLAACSEDATLDPGNVLSAGSSSLSQSLSSGSLSSGSTSSQPVLDTEKPVVALLTGC